MRDKLNKPQALPKSKRLIALKDFLIVQNEYRREIKAGDDLTDVPERFLENLKTEGVIKDSFANLGKEDS